MMFSRTIRTCALAGALAAALAGASPDSQPASGPRSNLQAWLDGTGAPATAGGPDLPATASGVASPAASPFGEPAVGPTDALPGVAVLSDGTVLAGTFFTTGEKDWEVWVEPEQRWRHIPPVVVLSIAAEVVEETMELEWRWKETGSDEKVFTGRKRPFRRFLWRFRLADGSVVTGAVKGQPLWVQTHDGKRRLLVLHERSAGEYGQSLEDLVYLRRAVISRAAMEQALKRPTSASGATSPAAP